jgi:hypothetical protein
VLSTGKALNQSSRWDLTLILPLSATHTRAFRTCRRSHVRPTRSPRQRPTGRERYRSFVVDAKDESGKRRQTRRRGFATRRIAQAELTRVLSSLADNTYVSPQTTTVGEFLVGTWLPAIEHTIKPATFESYRRNVRLHVAGV